MKSRLLLQTGGSSSSSSPSMEEGKVIKEEVIGSPCSPPRPASGANISTINSSTTSTSGATSSLLPGTSPSGKENRRVASPLTTSSEILTRSRSKGLNRDNCHHAHSHHHHQHHHLGSSRMTESPKLIGLGTLPPPGIGAISTTTSSSSSQQQSPPIMPTSNKSASTGVHGKNGGYGHPPFSSPHSTTTSTANSSGNSRTIVTSPSPSPTGSLSNGAHNSSNMVRSTSSSSTASNLGTSRAELMGGGTGRLIVKIKRFLGTLLHFGNDISPEVGDRVRSLVFNLVSGHLSIEDFHHSLQEVTSFPLRPFVFPFLKAHLPLLQREVSQLARMSKQSTLSYIRSHEQVIVESGSSPGEPCDIFHSEAGDLGLPGTKRKNDSLYENGDGEPAYTSTPKRFNSGLFSPPFFLNGGSGGIGGSIASSSGELRDYYPTAATMGYHLLASQLNSLQQQQDSNGSSNHQTTTSTPLSSNVNGMTGTTPKGPEDEWRNIHVMLNCILSMVEKTKRALTILQTRTLHNELENNNNTTTSSSSSGGSSSVGSVGTNSWLRRPGGGVSSGGSGGFPSIDNSDDFKRHAGEMMAQALRVTEDRVAEVKRRAEDAVLEVKRQALVELQRAVAAAEARACEAVAAERARLERVFLESSRRAGGEAMLLNGPPADPETCWNCGRKAHETCSGCNMARYCSSFCQHKDWEHHHTICGRNHATLSDRDSRPLTNGNSCQDSKSLLIQENSNSPINVSQPSPDNRSNGSN